MTAQMIGNAHRTCVRPRKRMRAAPPVPRLRYGASPSTRAPPLRPSAAPPPWRRASATAPPRAPPLRLGAASCFF
ncbi:hypothetical protein GQ55_7G013900 [Panicum hallii var. hallii]|uniref:Uncharacterized protein n=1 Tax=Panicum hallii var. hallii TaxID=1504633 RepID=A0A2T7CRS5_9POAL|nr:hypothetical protein GQ55_7G013900 [Panicum hallii var. hallii]